MQSLVKLSKNLQNLPHRVLQTKNWQLKEQKRHLNVHEHISYTLLKEAGIGVPKFGVAKNKEEAIKAAESIGHNDLVVKAQVLAGGRGVGRFKGGLKGGVKMAGSPQECGELASKMIGDYLITRQTGEAGRICNKVMITERKYPKKEFYFSIMLERSFGGPVIIASSQGGVDIENVAATSPEAIHYEPINIHEGIKKEQALRIAKKVGMGKKAEATADMLMKMYKLFVSKDALLVEINPYAEDICDENFVLDCKCRFDDNAVFRQKELFALRDWTQEDPKEKAAEKHALNYIALDGTIGCMVNGAGLAMATMDIIKLHGGEPANFLDVGGGSQKEQIKEAFKIIVSDEHVLAILVNIFGGIMRCDIIAEGIVAACKELSLEIPVVCRLQGTNAEKGSKIIQESGLKIIGLNDLNKAAKLIVKLATIVELAKEANVKIKFEMPGKK